MFEHVAIPQLAFMGIEEPLGNSVTVECTGLAVQWDDPGSQAHHITSELQMLQKMVIQSLPVH